MDDNNWSQFLREPQKIKLVFSFQSKFQLHIFIALQFTIVIQNNQMPTLNHDGFIENVLETLHSWNLRNQRGGNQGIWANFQFDARWAPVTIVICGVKKTLK